MTSPRTTKLPFFNTSIATAATRSYNHATARLVSAVEDKEILLRQFAKFVFDVTGETEISFVADIDHDHLFVCTATKAAASNTHSAHVVPIQLAKTRWDPSCAETVNTDFGIHASTLTAATNNEGTANMSRTLHLSLRPATHAVTDISLFLRDDYGSEVAAQHLLQLAISNMSPEVRSSTTRESRIGSPLPPLAQQSGCDALGPLHTILEDSARMCPHNIAIDEVTGRRAGSYTRHVFTYEELDIRVSAFADELEPVLQNLSWPSFQGEQKTVPLFLSNSSELYICMNAISKIGHAFCPLPMDAPEERLRSLTIDLRAPGILGLGANPWAGTQFGDDIIWIDYLDPMACLPNQSSKTRNLRQSKALVRRTATIDDLAYVMYTSGSTGKPKGLMVPHSVAISFLRDMDAGPALLPAGPRLRWMAISAPTFDIVLMDNFMAPLKGGTICIAERSLLLANPEAIIHELRATAAFMVTSMAMVLRPERIPTLTWLIVGGELLGQRVVDNFAPKAGEEKPSRLLICGYGPAEATVFVSNHVLRSDSRPSVIGEPLPGMQFVVLDTEAPNLVAVPLGVAGELAVAGPQLSSGYLNRPEETARTFVEDKNFGRLYRTGDKVRVVWSENGRPKLDYLGRISTDQIKLNGRRIELPEIENVLSRADGAARVAVLVCKSKLIACVMPWDDDVQKEAIVEGCRAEAEKYLPTWMRPLHYHVKKKLPFSANGKVDRRLLDEILSQADVAKDGDEISAPITVAMKYSTSDSHDSAVELGTPSDSCSIVYQGLSYALGDEIQRQHRSAILVQLGLDSLSASIFLQKLDELGVTGLGIPDVLASNSIGDLIKTIEKQQVVQEIDANTVSIVYDGLADALGEHVRGQSLSAGLSQLGLDSLCALVFLQTLNDSGIPQLEMQHILAASIIADLVDIVGRMRPTRKTTASIKPPISNDESKPTKSDALPKSDPFGADGIDVSNIAADDAEQVFELPVDAKIRHFDYHCRPGCLSALDLTGEDVEEVLPVTNVQARFVAISVDPEFLDITKYVGRPQITHFPYNVPGGIDPARLQRAVDAVLPRFDFCRTVFVPVEHPIAPFAQCVLSPRVARAPKTEVICDDRDSDNRDSLWCHTINGLQRAAEAAMSIDKPGISVAWVWSPSRARCVMILSLFHGIYDGTQVNFLFDAVMAEYYKPGTIPSVDLLPIRSAVQLTLGYDWIETITYWAARLSGVPGSRLGRSQPVPRLLLPNPTPGFKETHMRSLSVKSSLTMRQLFSAAQGMSTNILTVAEAAWASVLAQTFADTAPSDSIAGKKSIDVQFGTVLNGRRHKDALRCMAPMITALPQRLVIDGTAQLTNREACERLAAQRIEAQPFLQVPCPTLAHARMGIDRFDSLLLLQALAPEKATSPLHWLPGFNFDENLMAPFKEVDVGFPITTELWPGSLKWNEQMLIRCAYSTARHEFLTHDWIHGALSALDEALVRITAEPDALFYIG